MKTIQEVIESTIRKTPFIEEALNEKLINVSSLARVILPEVSLALKKDVKLGAVMMAINRLSPASELRIRKNIKKLALDLGDVIVRSDLCDFTFKNTPSLLKEIAKILTKTSENYDYFLTVSQGIFETNIVTSKNLQPFVNEIFEKETLISNVLELASITIKLPKENLEQSGIYYFILKQLAWANISLQEIISTTNEMTIVVKEKDINQTFALLMDMKLS
jgi:aspartokinase